MLRRLGLHSIKNWALNVHVRLEQSTASFITSRRLNGKAVSSLSFNCLCIYQSMSHL